MPLTAGSRLGPYEIVSPLGSGGMGEVFRARDTRLDRSVAIKVLPHELASNPQLRQRFEREAKTISQLNHPHICVLYDVGQEEGTDFLVMELLEGETLADRLARGPLPLSETIRYGAQIADALDCAHRAGIVHRDLKPGNVMLLKGTAKLLDFGLAKPGAAVATNVATTMATEQKPLTQEGTIVGTFQYMAPEQLEGIEADPRTDIFALGAMLYEMVTGRRAFDGKTRTSLIAAIVGSDPPPLAQLQPLTPPALEHVIRKCLAKDPDERWQSAHDVAAELRWINEAGSQAGIAAPLTAKRKHRERLAWWLHLATALVAVALTWAFLHWRTPAARVVETSIVPPPETEFVPRQGNMMLSPDGTRIALIASGRNAPAMIYMRRLDSSDVRPLGGTEGASLPFWSPDSRQLGFFAEGKLKTIDIDQGSIQTVCDAPQPRGGSWGISNKILFAPSSSGAIMVVNADGGTPSPATGLVAGELAQLFPSFLPDGHHFIFLSVRPDSGIYAASLDDKKTVRLLSSNNAATYAPPGYLMFVRSDTLLAQPFDVKALEMKGSASPLAQQVALSGRRPLFSVSNDGQLAYQRGSSLNPTQLAWVDRQGKDLGILAPPALYFSPMISHDGKRVAVDISAASSGYGDIWTFDLARNRSSRLTFNPANESGPVWSADDREIFFFSQREGGDTDLFRIPSGGIGEEQALLKSHVAKLTADVSRDGQWLLFVGNSGKGQLSDIWTWSFRDKQAKPWLASTFNEAAPQLSPDGKWIAYQSDESGRNEIYVRSFPESQEKWTVSSAGGKMPAWRADGREINYISPDSKMMAVPVDTGNGFQSGTPVALFELRILDHAQLKQYDATDGTRFLLNRVVTTDQNVPLALVQNWTRRLRTQGQ